jgi:hypothetical protein
METALSGLGLKIETLSGYIADDTYKLIKLHGLVNWGRRVRAPDKLLQLEMWQLVHYLIDNADSLDITQDYRLVLQ